MRVYETKERNKNKSPRGKKFFFLKNIALFFNFLGLIFTFRFFFFLGIFHIIRRRKNKISNYFKFIVLSFKNNEKISKFKLVIVLGFVMKTFFFLTQTNNRSIFGWLFFLLLLLPLPLFSSQCAQSDCSDMYSMLLQRNKNIYTQKATTMAS